MEYTLITGACGGLGKVFVENLYAQNKNLILIGRDNKRLELLKSRIFKEGKGDIKCYQVDISNSVEVLNFFALVEKEKVEIDGLYYVAGGSQGSGKG